MQRLEERYKARAKWEEVEEYTLVEYGHQHINQIE